MTSLDVIKKIPTYYLAGFADGEGSFNLSFRRRKDYPQPWKISLVFQRVSDVTKSFWLCTSDMKCGTVANTRG